MRLPLLPVTVSGLVLFLAPFMTIRAATGDQYCSTALCVNALVSDNKVTYQLKSTLGFETLGWMGVGFGTQMPDSPMVITWPNEDGTITLSQREAPAHVMPTIVANPPQVAELAWENSILATNTTTIAFHLPLPPNLSQVDMIWAWSGVRPSSTAKDAVIQQHTDMGTLRLDLTKPMSALPTGTIVASVIGTSTVVVIPTPTGAVTDQQNPMGTPETDIPLSRDEKNIRTHAILMSLGFLVFLPFGVLVARYSRTIPVLRDKWFTAHWFIQFVISGPIIFAGWAKGYQHVAGIGKHFQDKHTKVGLALLVLYLVQLAWGAIIHFFKPASFAAPTQPTKEAQSTEASSSSSSSMPSSSQASDILPAIKSRPIQNYLHATNGIAIIALAFYNVRYGYHVEWPRTFGTTAAFLRSLNSWWISWIVIVPVIYFLGLLLLPRQWKMETESRKATKSTPVSA